MIGMFFFQNFITSFVRKDARSDVQTSRSNGHRHFRWVPETWGPWALRRDLAPPLESLKQLPLKDRKLAEKWDWEKSEKWDDTKSMTCYIEALKAPTRWFFAQGCSWIFNSNIKIIGWICLDGVEHDFKPNQTDIVSKDPYLRLLTQRPHI